MKKGILETVIMSGLGFASVTQKKVESMINKLVKEGEMSQKDGAAMAKKIMGMAEKSTKEMEKRTEKVVKDIMKSLDVPTKKDMDKIEKKIDVLNKSINQKK